MYANEYERHSKFFEVYIQKYALYKCKCFFMKWSQSIEKLISWLEHEWTIGDIVWGSFSDLIYDMLGFFFAI